MTHPYYQYNKQQLLAHPKIPLEVFPDNESVFRAMADEMVSEIKRKADLNETCVFICPVGPVGQYPYFVSRVNQERISLKHCWFINMDEYLDDDKQWVPMDHPLSFRGFMERTVYSQIAPELNVPKEQRVFPNPEDLTRIPALIDALGGVDICFGGIGINGHLAFNEADASKSPRSLSLWKHACFPSPRRRVRPTPSATLAALWRICPSTASPSGSMKSTPPARYAWVSFEPGTGPWCGGRPTASGPQRSR